MKKKLLSILLALTLLLQMIPAVVYADEITLPATESPGKYNYVAIGDSIVAGAGLDEDLYYDLLKNIADSSKDCYPKKVGEKLEEVLGNSSVTVSNLGVVAATVEDYTKLLDGSVSGIKDLSYWFRAMNRERFIEKRIDVTAWPELLNNEIKNADLITIQLGGNDIFSVLLDNDSALINHVEDVIGSASDIGTTIEGLSTLVGDVLDVFALLSTGDEYSIAESINLAHDIYNNISKADLEDIAQLISVFDIDVWSKLVASNVEKLADGTYAEFVDMVKSINEEDAEIALVGFANPYGNSVEYNNVRCTRGQLVAAILGTILQKAADTLESADTLEDTSRNSFLLRAVRPSDPFETALNRVKGIEEEIIENPEVVEEQEALVKETIEKANGILSNEEPEVVEEKVEEEVEVLEERPMLLAANSPMDNEYFMYGLVHHLLGGLCQQSICELNMIMKDVAEANGYPFISTYFETPNELNLNAHPDEKGHEFIAKTICNKLISTITLDDNNGGNAFKEDNTDLVGTAVYGTEITVNVPTGVEFVVVNNHRVWDARFSHFPAFTYTVTGPTYIYAHYYNNAQSAKHAGNALVAIGDSIATGFSFTHRNENDFDPEYVYEKSYVSIASKLLKKDNAYSLAQPAIGSDMISAFLGIESEDIKLNSITPDGALENVSEMTPVYDDYLSKSDVITLHTGANDFLVNYIAYLLNYFGIEFDINDVEDVLDAVTKENTGNAAAKVLGILMGIVDPQDLDIVEVEWALNEALVSDQLDKYTDIYQYNLARIAAALDKKIASNATVVGVGFYNPYEDVNINVDSSLLALHIHLPFGKLVDKTFAKNNMFLKSLMQAYGWEFADIRDTQTGPIDPHPTEAGHEYIAKQVCKALGYVIPDPTPIHHSSGKKVKPVEEEPKEDLYLTYSDLLSDFWYEDGIRFCLDNGLMLGIKNGIFDPTGLTSRAMMMTILARMDGCDTEGGENWYSIGQSWAITNKISDGSNPNGTITREQFATMLYNYAKLQGEGFVGDWMFMLDFFDHANISSWADEAMHWCVMKGILNGKPGNILDPKGFLTRAEAATMMYRFCGVVQEAK